MAQAGRANTANDQPREGGGPMAGRTVAEFDGRRLFELRRARWLMQETLGKLAIDPTDPPPQRGVSRGEVGHLERTHRRPTLRTLVRLARALGVDPSDLLARPYRRHVQPCSGCLAESLDPNKHTDLPAADLLAMRDTEAKARAARDGLGEAAGHEDITHEQAGT